MASALFWQITDDDLTFLLGKKKEKAFQAVLKDAGVLKPFPDGFNLTSPRMARSQRECQRMIFTLLSILSVWFQKLDALQTERMC